MPLDSCIYENYDHSSIHPAYCNSIVIDLLLGNGIQKARQTSRPEKMSYFVFAAVWKELKNTSNRDKRKGYFCQELFLLYDKEIIS